MATFLDFSILSGASAVFAFLLIFLLVYAVITYTGMFKMNQGIAAMIAFAIAVITVFSPSAVQVIQLVIPWYVLMMFIIFIMLLMVLIFGSLGNSGAEIRATMGEYYKTVVNFIIVIAVIILLAGLGQVYLGGGEHDVLSGDQNQTITTDGSNIGGRGAEAFIDALFHPKIVGLVAFFVIAVFTILLMGSKPS